MFSAEQVEQLSAKLDPSAVSSRQQGNAKLSYIEGWHAIAEANRIFGFGHWNRETLDVNRVQEIETTIGKQQNPGYRVAYTCKVRITVGEVVREGMGYGQGIDRDLGQAHESAVKEAETDAMKRALMTFGNPFGLALYDKSQKNVGRDTKPNGIDEDEKRARAAALAEAQKAEKAQKPEPSYEINPKGNWVRWLAVMGEKITAAPNLDALTKLQVDNKSNLDSFAEVNIDNHTALMGHFTQRMGDLMQGPTND